MASTTVRDFYLPYVRPGASEAQQLRVGRIFTIVWGIAQMGVALLAQGVDSALQEGLAALGYASGPTVGAFLLGLLTRTRDVGGHAWPAWSRAWPAASRSAGSPRTCSASPASPGPGTSRSAP